MNFASLACHLGAMDLTVSVQAALLAGIISFLSPCVLPLVPSYLCFITGPRSMSCPMGTVLPFLSNAAPFLQR